MGNGTNRSAGQHFEPLDVIVDLVREVSSARSPEDIMVAVTSASRFLFGADGVTFVLRDGDYCYYAEEDAISELWKGRRFPSDICISGWCMRTGQPAMIEDVFADERIPGDVYRATFVKSMIMVPIGQDRPVAALGAYWARPRQAGTEEIDRLAAIANIVGPRLQRLQQAGG